MNARQIAADWRRENGYQGKGGVVVVFNGDVAGWVNALRDPQQWEPGCIAVDEAGNTWVSTGGDSYRGADRWQPVRTRTAEGRAHRTWAC